MLSCLSGACKVNTKGVAFGQGGAREVRVCQPGAERLKKRTAAARVILAKRWHRATGRASASCSKVQEHRMLSHLDGGS